MKAGWIIISIGIAMVVASILSKQAGALIGVGFFFIGAGFAKI